MKSASFIAGLLLVFLSGNSVAASLADAPVVFRSGEWSVLRTVDQMTDETNCTGLYKGDYAIQLAKNDLFVSVRGGVDAVTLRFGDQPAEKFRLATRSEKNLGSIDLEGAEFSKLLGSSRLRMEVLTVLSHSVAFDIDLTGMAAAIENIRANCPGPAVETKSAQASACGDKVVARLREKGVAQDVINFACTAK